MKGKFYIGDCLSVMSRFPDESIDLIYIDPPFNTGRDFTDKAGSFSDKFENKDAYIDFLNLRVKQFHRCLKDTGSFYLHCDWRTFHYVKVMLDGIFGIENFRNNIIWKRNKSVITTSRKLGCQFDPILFYTKTGDYPFTPPYTEHTEEQLKNYRFTDDRGRYSTCPMTYKGAKEFDFNGVVKPWRFAKGKMKELLDKDMLVRTKTSYRRKKYLNDSKGSIVSDLFIDKEVGNIQGYYKESVGYPTQKPLALLERIIKASSDKNDIVLDAFCGSGTTCLAADKLGRRWLGIDMNADAIQLAKNRLCQRSK